MDAKHQFKYTYNETCIDEYSPHEITFEMPGEATLDQILYNFQSYLKAVGYVFDGELQIVDDTFNALDELDGTLYEFDEEEPQGGCMADFDKDVLDESEDCGCEEDCEYYKSKKLKEWNEGIAKLDNEQRQKCREEALKMSKLHDEAIKEVKKNKWFHGLCNPPSPDWKKSS